MLLTVGPGNYWMFGRYGNNKPKAKRGEQAKRLAKFTPQEAKLEGFDMPLQTTRFPNQYNAPGGLNPGKGGYHAWQSRDMKNWVHHGPVTEGFPAGLPVPSGSMARRTFTTTSRTIRIRTCTWMTIFSTVSPAKTWASPWRIRRTVRTPVSSATSTATCT